MHPEAVTSSPPRRGQLRIYLGAAPGVGKTFAMLNEAHRRADRGTDVVVGYVETHNRPRTAQQLDGLEVLPRRTVEHRGATLQEMDLDALLSRRPTVALVDELAHSNAPGSRHEKRWEDVEELLAAGIDVISTVNVQHLESLNDLVEKITGVRQRETVPDRVVRAAEQVELVDMTPEALRSRMTHGNIYAPEKVDAALSNYFRAGNLGALRELALFWLADEVDAALQRYLHDEQIPGVWETRERVLVAVTGAPSCEHLIRRAARMAARSHGDLIGVHLSSASGLSDAPNDLLLTHRRLLTDMGGEFHETTSEDVADGLVAFARSVRATQLVLGATKRTRWNELVRGSVINRVIRVATDLDVHVISDETAVAAGALPRSPRRGSPLARRRQIGGWTLVAGGGPLLTAMLFWGRDALELPSVMITYLLFVCLVAAIGGLAPALVAAVATALATNWFFTEPFYTLRIDDLEQALAIGVSVAAGALVSLLVGQAARRSADAARARAEAEALVDAVQEVAPGSDPVPVLLSHLRITFGQHRATIRRSSGDGGWSTVLSDGDEGAGNGGSTVDEAEHLSLSPDLDLELVPGGIPAQDLRVLRAFGARLVDALERRSLEDAAENAIALARGDELRSAILRAVSHDLRSPLASIKASATSLLQDDVAWSTEQRNEFASTIDEEADRLDRLIGNLLDMSRIEAGAFDLLLTPVGLDDVITLALANLSESADRVDVHLDDDAPAAMADLALMERAVANIISNALRHSPPDTRVQVEATSVAGSAVVRIVDHGPGVPDLQRDRMFAPFQRLGDQGTAGIGLGLAVAQGFMDAMEGTLDVGDTPGGGLSVTLSLPLAEAAVETGSTTR